MDVTLLVCTRNRAGSLTQLLLAILELNVPAGLTWEVLVVANACTDDTREVVKAFAERHHTPPVRLLIEPRRGVGYARKRGITESQARLIAYMDDDCVPHRDWLAAAVDFAEQHPLAGAFGGRNTLVWEHDPSSFVLAYGASLAGQNWGEEPRRLSDRGKAYPCGAGLVLRHDAVVASGYLDRGCLRGRRSAALGAGEDTEVQIMIRDAGWEIWYAPTLELDHVIPSRRMQLGYLCRLHAGFGLVEVYLRLLSERAPLTLRNRWQGLRWAFAELRAVLARFRLGFVEYKDERPSWLIRLCYSLGCLAGAVKLLCLGRAS